MKILKMSLMITLMGIIGCGNEQNADVVSKEDVTTLKQKMSQTYSLEDILNGIRAWEEVRSNKDTLLNLFSNKNALTINMADFPLGNDLHAYACILHGELKFAIISEVYDNESYHTNLINYIKVVDLNFKDTPVLNNINYLNKTYSLSSQYIKAKEALQRIDSWKTTFISWIPQVIQQQGAIYQSFNIPTHGLAIETYDVYMGLKTGLNPNLKDADLVLANSTGDSFFDTVIGEPPYKDRTKNYILNLL